MKRLVIVAAATSLGVAGLGAAGFASAGKTADATSVAATSTAALDWHACKKDLVDAIAAYDALGPVKVSKIVQCAELQVPLDHAKPDGQKITLQLTKTPKQGSGPAKGDIVVNPGGPGGAGAPFGARVYAQNSPAMQAAYNVIGFDPRGVGRSVPALSCDKNYTNAPRPSYGEGDAKSVETWLKLSKGYAESCKKADKIGLLNHLKTTDSAKDLELIRQALGSPKLDYYGASYGTFLGANYAALYPKNVGKMVFDGVVGPKDAWYDANLNQDVAFDKNLEYYFGWIARNNATYGLGTSQRAVSKFFYDLRKTLETKPVYGKDVAVGPVELTDNIQTAGYRRSAAVWSGFAKGLSAYKKGDLATFADTFGVQTKGGSDDNGYAIYSGVQCTDVQWPLDWKKWQRDNDRLHKKHPFLTWGNAWYNTPCLTWPAKAGKPLDIERVKDLPKNVLMFQSTADAATPYAGAKQMHRIFKGSRLVIQDGDRTHCIVHRGSAAVDAYFDNYFLKGELPEQSRVHVPQLGDPKPLASIAAKTAKAAAE
ncbi:alpha/beta hydrolase [Spirillospora sp. CA-294931]|uniref:alpha/beta hydrolase n=1 Tax=Spirillospora sp. CA-294931 TaxID=3240042 RepID=UPI003D8E93AC